MTEHEKDLTIPCPVCLAGTSEECKTDNPKLVHLTRRVKRLLIEKCPELLELN